MHADLGPVLKSAYPKVVATLTRLLGDMDLAMDAAQDALVKALQTWPKTGLPDSPSAWLVTVGRNRAIDQMRRAKRVVGLDNVVAFPGDAPVDAVEPPADDISLTELDDDMLRLMFTCCHPVLNPTMQITLVMKVVLGFSVDEIARSLLSSRASVEKRITRAKTALAQAEVEYEVPRGEEIPPRLQSVLQAIYLMFNEGYTRVQDGQLSRSPLIDEAIRLARMTCRLLRRNPEPRALLALMLLTAARMPARFNEQGWLIPLTEQDRGLWDRAMTREGVALVDAIYVARHPPSAYQIQAAISALHNQSDSAKNTDWQQISGLYAKLREYDPSPVIPVNEAVAVCMTGDSDSAQQILDQCADDAALKSYQPYYAALAFVAEARQDLVAARRHYQQAIEQSDSPAQQAYLEHKLVQLG